MSDFPEDGYVPHPKSGTAKAVILNILSDKHWHPGWEFQSNPDIGVMDGLRILRSLRGDDGHDIRKRKRRGTTAYEYRLFTNGPTPAPTPTSTPPSTRNHVAKGNHGVKRKTRSQQQTKRYLGYN